MCRIILSPYKTGFNDNCADLKKKLNEHFFQEALFNTFTVSVNTLLT